MFIRSITMDEVKLACTSSNECGAQEASSQKDTLLDLHNQIAHLFCTRLSENSIMRKLRRAMTLANTQVKLLLTLLGMLYEEIISGCRELEVFIIKYDQGLVDSDMAASTQEKLQRTHQYLNDFESRLTRNLGPLDLQNQLILNTGQYPMPQLSASLAIKMPVMFDRCESRVTSNAAHLCWGVASQQSKEPCQEFEIHMKSLHPTADQDQFIKSTCQSYSIHFNNLTPDRYYQFSVKRVDTVNLVYGLWTDTIILKTVSVFK
ncbi:fibronectin type III domain-containing protein 11-like isoform X3 [Thunnus thynnus]|uniref:fibronectin type III domain-containing protein 11-like isoform X3 n=1 Tax=Thunnus thynnus TaxID=8237 RepID=UPI003527C0D7